MFAFIFLRQFILIIRTSSFLEVAEDAAAKDYCAFLSLVSFLVDAMALALIRHAGLV
jgi:hypothetical protein